jgi:hypothetical protein
MPRILEALTVRPMEVKQPKPAVPPPKPPGKLIEWLDADDQKAFASGILNALGQQAFGTMQKRELDLLIFHLLSKTKQLQTFTNYKWANLLRISESRVRALRADAALRFEQADSQAALTRIAKTFCAPQETCLDYDEQRGRIRLLLDDPTLQREFEYAVRNLGRVPDYSFNRNILDIPATTFVAVFRKNFPAYEEQFSSAFKKITDKDKTYQDLIEGTKGWYEQFNAICEKHKAKLELLAALIHVVIAAAGSK